MRFDKVYICGIAFDVVPPPTHQKRSDAWIRREKRRNGHLDSQRNKRRFENRLPIIDGWL